jgi:hypothetical protein
MAIGALWRQPVSDNSVAQTRDDSQREQPNRVLRDFRDRVFVIIG